MSTTSRKVRNPVAKYDWKVNKAATYVQRKAAAKRGARKHKTPW